MTNEELAQRIQCGETEFIPELWDSIEPFIQMRAAQFLRAAILTQRVSDPAIDAEDLVQESYFGMLKAVEYFDPRSGYAFLTYLKNPLLKSFYKATGMKRRKIRRFSMDAPTGDEETPLSEVIEDARQQNGFAAVMSRDWQFQAFVTLLEALELFERKEQLFMWRHYFEGCTLTAAAEAVGYDGSRQGASALHKRILGKLRHCSKTRELRALLDDIDCMADIGSLPYRSPADIAAWSDLQVQKRRAKAWRKKTLYR